MFYIKFVIGLIRDFLNPNRAKIAFKQKIELLRFRNKFNKIHKKVINAIKKREPIIVD